MHSGTNFIGKKQEIIDFYNSTKCGVDVFDQMSANMSCSRKTRRWPLCIFYGMLNTSLINPWVIYKENVNNENFSELPEQSKLARRKFALELSNELARNWMAKRLAIPNLPKLIKDQIMHMLNIPNPCIAVVKPDVCEKKIDKQKRCSFCGPAKDRKTKILCSDCLQPVCIEHKVSVCIECRKNNT